MQDDYNMDYEGANWISEETRRDRSNVQFGGTVILFIIFFPNDLEKIKLLDIELRTNSKLFLTGSLLFILYHYISFVWYLFTDSLYEKTLRIKHLTEVKEGLSQCNEKIQSIHDALKDHVERVEQIKNEIGLPDHAGRNRVLGSVDI